MVGATITFCSGSRDNGHARWPDAVRGVAAARSCMALPGRSLAVSLLRPWLRAGYLSGIIGSGTATGVPLYPRDPATTVTSPPSGPAVAPHRCGSACGEEHWATADSELFERGLQARRDVLGAEYVDANLADADEFMHGLPARRDGVGVGVRVEQAGPGFQDTQHAECCGS